MENIFLSKKHAYLIMTHNNFYILEKLLLLLDDPRNDIYIHIDRKVRDFDFSYFQNLCKASKVYYPKKRINVKWGTQSQVITELLLYETAFANGPYEYYHLISGVDLPLKSQDAIHAFFSGKKIEYVYFKKDLNIYDYMRVSRYHFALSKGKISAKFQLYAAWLQSLMHTDRTAKLGIVIRRGHNWCDLTQQAVEWLLSKRKDIFRLTRFSLCADEVYKQTFLPECNVQIENDDLRLTDWSRSQNGNNPHIFTMEDWDMLMDSDKLFARKFDVTVDKAVVDRLFKHVRAQKDS